MSTRYAIGNNFLGTLISLVIRYKPKSIHLNRHDLSRLKFTLLSSIDPQIRLDSTGTKIIVKTGNSIRNPKDFDLFIETYIESNLSLNNSVSLNTVLFQSNYAPGEYVEESINKYGDWELQSQDFLTIVTQGGFDETSIETQSPLLFGFIESQTGQPLRARYVNTSESFRTPILAKGSIPQSYTRTYKN